MRRERLGCKIGGGRERVEGNPYSGASQMEEIMRRLSDQSWQIHSFPR